MFDFLFKRQGSKPAASGEQQGAVKPAPAKSGAAQPAVSKTGGKAGSKADNKAKAAAAAAAEQAANQAAAQAAEARAAVASARERQAAQLKALGSDEAAAAEFILQSPFSELRLAAAELLHGREHLERVYGAMRNVDATVHLDNAGAGTILFLFDHEARFVKATTARVWDAIALHGTITGDFDGRVVANPSASSAPGTVCLDRHLAQQARSGHMLLLVQ